MNDQAAIDSLIAQGRGTRLGGDWAIDLAGIPAAWAIALLLPARQRLVVRARTDGAPYVGRFAWRRGRDSWCFQLAAPARAA